MRSLPMLLVLCALAAAPDGAAQADARLYQRAWYLESVVRRPEEALQAYRRLASEHPDSPLRHHAMARQADLLRRLRRLREATLLLENLYRETSDPAVLRDKQALEEHAERIHERELLLQKLLRLRNELAIAKRQVAGSGPGSEAENARDRFRTESANLIEEIEALKPRLLAGNTPAILEVKRQAQVQGLQSDEARRLGGEMVRLRDQARALQEAGMHREARQTLQELDRLRGRYRTVLDRFRGRPGPTTDPGESLARFLAALEQGELAAEFERDGPIRFWVLSQFVRFLADTEERLPLDLSQLRFLLRGLEAFVPSMALELEEQSQEATARRLETVLAQLLQELERERPANMVERLQELGTLITPLLWRAGTQMPRPTWPVVPGTRGGWGAGFPERPGPRPRSEGQRP